MNHVDYSEQHSRIMLLNLHSIGSDPGARMGNGPCACGMGHGCAALAGAWPHGSDRLHPAAGHILNIS